jgi:hypothetical protein
MSNQKMSDSQIVNIGISFTEHTGQLTFQYFRCTFHIRELRANFKSMNWNTYFLLYGILQYYIINN